MYWAHLAELAPGVANFVTRTPVLRDLAKGIAGISPEREIPSFAAETFKQWFRRRPPRNVGGPKVILWADTFNDHFLPDTLKAAVEVLESGGFQVQVPEAHLCCGRPVYDFGMLNVGERLLRQIVDTLRPEIEAGVPIVGLEPSCVAVFRDELTGLFPHEEDAIRLSRQTYMLSEFLQQHAADFPLPKLDGRAIVHGHCHHKAIMGMDAEVAVLKRLGIDFTVLDDGCCGMAGAFGFEAEHYDVSKRVGERVLLPAVRNAAPETLIVTDGFSCREQIAQLTPRRAIHLSELLQRALRQGRGIEETAEVAPPPTSRLKQAGMVGAAAAVGLAGYLLWRRGGK
jgi:Fe-S oxidoreductase